MRALLDTCVLSELRSPRPNPGAPSHRRIRERRSIRKCRLGGRDCQGNCTSERQPEQTGARKLATGAGAGLRRPAPAGGSRNRSHLGRTRRGRAKTRTRDSGRGWLDRRDRTAPWPPCNDAKHRRFRTDQSAVVESLAVAAASITPPRGPPTPFDGLGDKGLQKLPTPLGRRFGTSC